MATLRRFVLVHAQARDGASKFSQEAPEGTVCVFSEPTRSLEQNAALWPILQAFADQLEWPVNGKMCRITPDEFKDILSAAFKGESVRLAMGLNGGVVMLGQRTSLMSKREFSEFLEFLHSVAVDRGVNVDKETA